MHPATAQVVGGDERGACLRFSARIASNLLSSRSVLRWFALGAT
jgi:hypothetical protein